MKEKLTQREKALLLRALCSYTHEIPEKIPKKVRNEYNIIKWKITSQWRKEK